MNWYVVYRGKPVSGSIQEAMAKAGITYYIPLLVTEKLNEEGTRMEAVEETAIRNIIFIQTDQNILSLIDKTDGLRCPMMDSLTGSPSIVSDSEMKRFMLVISRKNKDVLILRENYAKFQKNQKVRVKAGDFEGIEGYVVRILRDRKLVISLGSMAVAISGIDRSLFEPIESSK